MSLPISPMFSFVKKHALIVWAVLDALAPIVVSIVGFGCFIAAIVLWKTGVLPSSFSWLPTVLLAVGILILGQTYSNRASISARIKHSWFRFLSRVLPEIVKYRTEVTAFGTTRIGSQASDAERWFALNLPKLHGAWNLVHGRRAAPKVTQGSGRSDTLFLAISKLEGVRTDHQQLYGWGCPERLIDAGSLLYPNRRIADGQSGLDSLDESTRAAAEKALQTMRSDFVEELARTLKGIGIDRVYYHNRVLNDSLAQDIGRALQPESDQQVGRNLIRVIGLEHLKTGALMPTIPAAQLLTPAEKVLVFESNLATTGPIESIIAYLRSQRKKNLDIHVGVLLDGSGYGGDYGLGHGKVHRVLKTDLGLVPSGRCKKCSECAEYSTWEDLELNYTQH